MADEDIFSVVGRWLDWLEVRELSPQTRRNYADAVLRAGRLARKDPRTFGPDDVVSVLGTYRKHAGAKLLTLRALRSFASYAEPRGLMAHGDCTRDLRMRNLTPGEVPSLSDEELRALVRAAFRRQAWRGWTLLLLYSTGGRLESVASLRAEDARDGALRFRVMKGGGEHRIPLSRTASLAVRNLQRVPRPRARRDTLVGVGPETIWEWVREASVTAGVSIEGRPAWPHLFRHTAGTVGYRKTHDPVAVARYLGHKDLRQVMRYVGDSDEQKRAVADAIG
jgi:integrase